MTAPAQDKASAQSIGIDENSEALAARKVTVPEKYAPKGWLHPDEEGGPLSPGTFLNHSDLVWNTGRCGATAMISATPKAAKVGNGSYSHHSANPGRPCTTNSAKYYSNQNIRPSDEGNPLPRAQGMYLDLEDGYRDGQAGNDPKFGGDEPVYYDYVPQGYLIYWFSWGNSFEKVGPLKVGTHEGDWERVAIKLDSANNPVRAQYFYHEDSCTLPWADAPKKNSHLKLWFAKNAHGVYPANAATPGNPYGPVTYYDDISGSSGDIWYGSADGVLRRVQDQSWYGYGGGWGDHYGVAGAQWGPLGPNYFHANTPPTFGTKACKVN